MPRHFSDDRRRFPRRTGEPLEALLQGGLGMIDARHGEDNQEYPLNLYASAQSISATGLSLVVPHFPIDLDYCDAEDGRQLVVTLFLPTGTVKMKVSPVRCLPLDKQYPEKGFLIGAQIKEIDNDARERLAHYLHSSKAKGN